MFSLGEDLSVSQRKRKAGEEKRSLLILSVNGSPQLSCALNAPAQGLFPVPVHQTLVMVCRNNTDKEKTVLSKTATVRIKMLVYIRSRKLILILLPDLLYRCDLQFWFANEESLDVFSKSFLSCSWLLGE